MTTRRLHLRRVMHNKGPASTRQLNEEEFRRTIIPINYDRRFGRDKDNDVLFYRDVQDQDKGDQNISRIHAVIYYRKGEKDGVHVYLLEDCSKSGTYVNDLRLNYKKPKVLKSGDTIKFGHYNGESVRPGEYATQEYSDWTFLVEEMRSDVAKEPKKTLKLFANSPITHEVLNRDNSSGEAGRKTEAGRSTGVLQQEADSTNDVVLIEPQMFGHNNSYARHDVPSTSQIPQSRHSTTSHDPKFSDPTQNDVVICIYNLLIHGKLAGRSSAMAKNLANKFPGISIDVFEKLASLDLRSKKTDEERMEMIKDKINSEMSKIRRAEVTSNFKKTDKIAVVDADSSADSSVPTVNSRCPGSSYPGASSSSFQPVAPTVSRPIALRPNIDDDHYAAFLNTIQVSSAMIQAAQETTRVLYPTIALTDAMKLFLPSMANVVHGFPTNPRLYGLANRQIPESNQPVRTNGNQHVTVIQAVPQVQKTVQQNRDANRDDMGSLSFSSESDEDNLFAENKEN
uniref:FHA domain-containing protein n=1 Tax=Caenorhabditis japonica TaxID=281687 RepID=A0A8R1EHS7_CAEJA